MLKALSNCLVDSSYYNINIALKSHSHVLFVHWYVDDMHLNNWSWHLKFGISPFKSWKHVVSFNQIQNH